MPGNGRDLIMMLCCHCLTDLLPLMPSTKESFWPDLVFLLGRVTLLYGSCCEHTDYLLQRWYYRGALILVGRKNFPPHLISYWRRRLLQIVVLIRKNLQLNLLNCLLDVAYFVYANRSWMIPIKFFNLIRANQLVRQTESQNHSSDGVNRLTLTSVYAIRDIWLTLPHFFLFCVLSKTHLMTSQLNLNLK